MVYGAAEAGTGTAFTAQAGTTLIDNYLDTTNSSRYGAFQSTAVTGTPGATLFGSSAPTGAGWYSAAAAEILPDGAIQEDPSAPAVANNDTGITVTTAAFSPPPGSLLLALVSSNGNRPGHDDRRRRRPELG